MLKVRHSCVRVFFHFQNLFLIFGLLLLAGRFVSSAAIFLLARLLIM
jgi:hypothetical protein